MRFHICLRHGRGIQKILGRQDLGRQEIGASNRASRVTVVTGDHPMEHKVIFVDRTCAAFPYFDVIMLFTCMGSLLSLRHIFVFSTMTAFILFSFSPPPINGVSLLCWRASVLCNKFFVGSESGLYF